MCALARAFLAASVVLLAASAPRAAAGEPSDPDPVQRAIDDLSAPSPDVRASAAGRLGAPWPAAVRAAPFLAIALEDEDPRVRTAAFAALSGLAERAVGVVAEASSEFSEDPLVRMILRIGCASGPVDVARSLGERGPSASDLRPLLTALAVVPFCGADTHDGALRLSEQALAVAAAALHEFGASPLETAAAAAVALRALEVARRRGFTEPMALAPDLRARLVAGARSPEPPKSLAALRLLWLARARGPDVVEAALPALAASDSPGAATALALAASEGPTPRVVTLVNGSSALGPAVFELEESQAWWALEAMLRSPSSGLRAWAGWRLLAAGRGGEPAAEALTANLRILTPTGMETGFDREDPDVRRVVTTAVRAGDLFRHRLELHAPHLTLPRRLVLADALAHADAPSAEGARVSAQIRSRGGIADDVLLTVADGDEALSRARARLREPAVDLAGVRAALRALARLGPEAKKAGPEVARALDALGDSSFASVPSTLAGIAALGNHFDDRFEACRMLLTALAEDGPAARGEAPMLERLRDGGADPRLAHLAARTLRRIAAR